jgi:hypothetical protein
VFPCKPDKSPYTPRGFKDGTTNPGRVNAFWNRYLGAQIGMRKEYRHLAAKWTAITSKRPVADLEVRFTPVEGGGSEKIGGWCTSTPPHIF